LIIGENLLSATSEQVSLSRAGWANPRLSRRIPELDGLRGLAILLILILHYFVEITYASGWLATLIRLLRLSWTGIDLFFVLSGFLIGGILIDSHRSRSYYGTFYCRRFFRIVPLYAISIVIFLIGVSLVSPNAPKPLTETFNRNIPLWAYPLFAQTGFMAFHNTFGSGWMGVTWSLAVEEQFYLLLPLMIWYSLRRPKAIWYLPFGMILLAPVVRLVIQLHAGHDIATYTLLPCRIDAFGFGLLAALICRDRDAWAWLTSHRRHLFGVFLALGAGLAIWTADGELGFMKYAGYTWVAGFYTSLLLLAVVNPGMVAHKVFSHPILTKLGTFAYAIYLFHSGTIRLLHYAFFRATPSIRSLPTLLVTILSLITVLSFSAISWRFFEKPIIQRAHARYFYAAEEQVPRALSV
jgi:peptidoglycan/LPS O-acetylase OafA/YrhL